MAKKPSGLGPVAQVVAIARVIVGDPQLRRKAMQVAVLIAAAQCFIGTVVIRGGILDRPVVFLCYWGLCLFFVMVAVGLALLDMLKLRTELKAGLKDLKEDLDDDVESSDG